MRRIFLLFIFVCAVQFINAQVKGVIVDSSAKMPLKGAAIALVIKNNLKDTNYVLANEKGEFSFEKVPASSFSVVITNAGYKHVAKFVPVNNPLKTIDLGTIILTTSVQVLSEVVIEIPPIIIKEDTIEYRADAFKVKENAVVEDLLKKLPGIQVDKNGNITAQGKSVTKVKVNGKDFFGGDPKTATRELPANIVDKVQIVDDYGDQATISGIKDGEPQKVMNIQLKKDKNTGYFGRLTAGGGDKNLYQLSFNGNYFKDDKQISLFTNSNNTGQSLFNFGGGANRGMGNIMSTAQNSVNDMGGSGSLVSAVGNGDQGFLQSNMGSADGITTTNSIGTNFRDKWGKKLNIYGSYSYSTRNTKGYKVVSQQNIFQNKVYLNNQDNNFVNKGVNHRFYFNMEYNIDSFNYIKISPNVSYGISKGFNDTRFDYNTDANGKTSEGTNTNRSGSTAPNLSSNILFNHKFRKRGRNFSVNVNAGTSGNSSDQDSRNNTIRYVPFTTTLNNYLYNSQENDNSNYGLRFTYSEPLSKVRSLDLAYSHNFSYARNNKSTFNIDPVTGFQIFNPFLSNDYENNFYTNRANISVRTTEKKYNYTVGLSMQPVNLYGFSNTKDSAYKPIKRVNIFPVLRLAYNFSKTASLTFNYRGDAQQPSFSQLQDVRDSSNLQYQKNGNPNLKPSINHSVNFFFNKFNFATGKILFTNFTFSTIQNQIINRVTQIDSAGAQLTVPQNVNGFYNGTGFYTFSKPYKNRKYIISLNGRITYTHNVNLVDYKETIGNNWVVSQGLNFELNIKEWLQFGAGTTYETNSVKYSNQSSATSFKDQQYGSWIVSSNVSIDIPKKWVLKYDFDYTINNGLTGDVGQNVALLNASIEKQLFKKKSGIIRFQAFDLFNQNSNISRTVNANSITDSRSSRLTRYFMLSFTYRIQKFSGKQAQAKPLSNMIRIGG